MDIQERGSSVISDILHGRSEKVLSATETRADTGSHLESESGCVSFGWVNSDRERADMLQFRLKSGTIGALSYGWVEWCEFEPSTGITLEARGMTFRIIGRNLNEETDRGAGLFEGIAHRLVTWVRESDRSESMEVPDSGTVVDSITW